MISASGTRPIHSIEPQAPLSEALAAMIKHRIHHLVVAQSDQILGVLSDRSVLEAQFKRGFASLAELKAGEALDTGIGTVDERVEVRQALRALLDRGDSALLVRDHERVAAIVTETDLLRALDRILHHRSVLESLKGQVEGFLAEPVVRFLTKILGDSGI